MIVDTGYLIYDDADERCKFILKQSQGALFAFVVCIDKGCPSDTKNYWGEFDWDSKEQAIHAIMDGGGKWYFTDCGAIAVS